MVELLGTEGNGLEAEVLLNGERLTVMDAFSPPLAPTCPGPLGNVRFSANEFTGRSWEDIFSGNPNQQKKLEQVQGWTYEGYGQIVSIQPTVIDFAILKLEGGPHTHDARCVGAFVRVLIDRLDLYAEVQ